jgi:hypothetical protein
MLEIGLYPLRIRALGGVFLERIICTSVPGLTGIYFSKVKITIQFNYFD